MNEGKQDTSAASSAALAHSDSLLANLESVAHAIVAMFGEECEVVIHDLSDWGSLDHTVVSIVGNVTGRGLGSPPTDVLLQKLRARNRLGDFMVYSSATKDGKTLKSSTTFVKDGQGRVIGAFCVNLDTTRLRAARAVLDAFCSANADDSKLDVPEVYASVVTETLDSMIDDVVGRSGKLVAHMVREDKVHAVSQLERRGAFLIRGAVDQVARRLGVSRYTVYNYINEVRADSSS